MHRTSFPRLALLVLIIAVLTACTRAEPVFDVVILGGRVMDPESRFDATANVGIQNGRITRITQEPITGIDSIDATGLVVAPDFIDTHFHWPRPMGYKLALRDGVTTPMDLEFGTHGPRVSDWCAMHDGRSQVNYGTAASHEAARAAVLDGVQDGFDAPGPGLSIRAGQGWAYDVLEEDTGNQLLEMLDEGLRQGALGNIRNAGHSLALQHLKVT